MTYRLSGGHSVKNSSEAPLGVSETFTGEWEDCRSFDSIAIALRADTATTIYIDFTSNISNGVTDSTLSYKASANINEVHRLTVTRPFFRIRVVNGTSAQSYLSLSSMLGNHAQLAAPANLTIGLDADATVVRPTIAADEIVTGHRAGVSPFTKFGERTGLTASAGEETVWDTTGNFVPMTVASTFTITYNSSTDGLGTTGATQLYFYYIDSDGLSTITPHVLSNTGSDVTAFSGLGINRAVVSASGSANFNTNNITITETTGATTQAIIPATESVTQQAIFFTDANSVAVTKSLWVHSNKVSGGGSPRVIVKGFVFNRTFETRYQIFKTTIDTGVENTINIIDPVGFKLSATDVLYFVADTDTNNASIEVRFSLVEYKND